QARAEVFSVRGASFVHIDPDRRARSATRASTVRDYVPGIDFLRSLPTRFLGGAIKLGPASDFDAHFGSPNFEVELISLAGECKEATVWFGELPTCHRRATVLPNEATWSDQDGPRVAMARKGPVSTWIYDADPALLRSGLLDSLAVVHELDRVAPDVDF